ncbi:type I-E CRISPR-associated protein Cas7/Cse4/CasC [Nocardia sp. NPDC049190]|uniref:type I-E CRISPR-associated protein Cas7/Cse4/CasC n=1 Tax=Nocardia sp. NPDC049190 TaxID=3155650 RepID=UPI0033D8AD39
MPSPRLFIDIHILQSLPPSNANRDENGTPKHAQYGAVQRARVSSQAWKRATRTTMTTDEQHTPEKASTRTKRIAALVTARLAERSGIDRPQAARLANSLLANLEITAGRRPTETAYLLYFGKAQVDGIVALVADQAVELVALADEELAKAVKNLPVKEQLSSGHPVDVALFGRMVARIPQLNVDAAVQVAHSLSTHAVQVEFDFFTATDDEKPRSEGTGAEMMDTTEFNSALYYRYATVGVQQLIDNLDGDTDAALTALERFVNAFTRSVPTGHQTSFAHHTRPYLASLVVRDCPVNMVTAFERPVRSTDGIAAESAKRLAAEFAETQTMWGYDPIATHSSYPLCHIEDLGAELGQPLQFARAVEATIAAVRDKLPTEGRA